MNKPANVNQLMLPAVNALQPANAQGPNYLKFKAFFAQWCKDREAEGWKGKRK